MNEKMSMNMQDPIDANSCLSTLKYSEYSENWCVQTLCSEIPIYILFPEVYMIFEVCFVLLVLGFGFGFFLFLICNQYVWVAMATRASKLTLATEVMNYIFS